MIINLSELFSNVKDEILIEEKISFDENYISNTDIKELNDVSIKGRIYKDSSDEINMNIIVDGKMLLTDSINLEDIFYPFHIEIDENIEENLENNENTIDIMEILWQNIVLEIPLKYTSVEDFSDIKGDGWKLVSEDEIKNSNNPFLELKEKMKEE